MWGILAVAAPAPARAEPSDPGKLLRQAVELFDNAKFAASLALLNRAATRETRPLSLGRVRLYQGLCHAVMGQRSAARRAFTLALHADPDLKLDPQRFKRDFVEIFAGVRSSLRGRLQVEADGPGAQVHVNGRPAGLAPLTAEYPIGSHYILVRGPEGRILLKTVFVISPAATTRLDVRLGQGPAAGPQRRRVWTWVAAGGALASLCVGIGMWAWADADHGEFLSTPDPARYDELEQGIRGRDTAAVVMFSLAGALAATAAVLFYFEGRPAPADSGPRPALAPRLSASGLTWDLDLP